MKRKFLAKLQKPQTISLGKSFLQYDNLSAEYCIRLKPDFCLFVQTKLRRLLNVLKVKETSSSALQSSDNFSEDVPGVCVVQSCAACL